MNSFNQYPILYQQPQQQPTNQSVWINGIEYRPPQNPGEEAYAYYLAQVYALQNTKGASPGFGLNFGPGRTF